MNYIGSKRSLLGFLDETISSLSLGHKNKLTICDGFAGTGVVGAFLRNKGHKIIANDLQYYSYVLNYNLICNNTPELGKLDCLNDLNGVEGFIYQNYCQGSGSGRYYFSDQNGKKCDAIRQEIEHMFTAHEITESQYYGYLACLIEAVDKVANTASVYGAFLKNLKPSAQKTLKLTELPQITGPVGAVYNQDINDLVATIAGDILYLDPPYNTRQYSANYHVLETIARYDNPEIVGKTGLRRDNKKSKYSSKRQVLQEFESVIKNSKFKVILLSYNNEGLMGEKDIEQVMSKYGEYSLRTKAYRRFRADKTTSRHHKASQTVEYLHVLVKNL